MTEADKVQIGLTETGDTNLTTVMSTGWFATAMDAYRLAVALALASGVVAPASDVVGSDTKYSFFGGVDRDGRLRSLISALAPDEAALPARYSERLAHAGLAILAKKLADEDALLADALGAPAQPKA